MTDKQLNAYLTRHFFSLRGQVSRHSHHNDAWSVQVFKTCLDGQSRLVCDMDCPKSLADIGARIRRAMPTAAVPSHESRATQ
jgi:hypothetical protein